MEYAKTFSVWLWVGSRISIPKTVERQPIQIQTDSHGSLQLSSQSTDCELITLGNSNTPKRRTNVIVVTKRNSTVFRSFLAICVKQ